MTKEDIKKALNICAQENLDCSCCCYSDNYTICTDRLKNDALALIIEQEREIEQLKDSTKCSGRLPKTPAMQYVQELIDCALMKQQEDYDKQVQADTINTIVKYCENPNHWDELKDCKLFGGKSDDLRFFINGIFKEKKQ